MRHFALKGHHSEVLPTSKGQNKSFPPPPPPCSVVPLFELRIENNKHPNFEWMGGGGGGMWIISFTKVTPYEDSVSKNFVADCTLKHHFKFGKLLLHQFTVVSVQDTLQSVL